MYIIIMILSRHTAIDTYVIASYIVILVVDIYLA